MGRIPDYQHYASPQNVQGMDKDESVMVLEEPGQLFQFRILDLYPVWRKYFGRVRFILKGGIRIWFGYEHPNPGTYNNLIFTKIHISFPLIFFTIIIIQ